ncbi:predicted protein [Nematostella vectensis]|uniref:SAP domain-containing protein n=1 Tax=Nematostella vectensis TaxID=45351 RepID=A7S5X6_NEMVE|nr:predicted protein [Nematostella vectensis]|eukprot:XP_001632944.1 predicted protein [Nematostella vectensis]
MASKEKYYEDYFSAHLKNVKEIWKGIKQIITLKASPVSIPSKIITSDSVLTDPTAISNAFNNYFTNIGKYLANDIPDTAKSFSYYLKKRQPNSFCLFPILPNEIESEICKLNSNKSTGPFSIPTRVLKSASSILSKPLAMLYYFSIESGIVPDKFKIAKDDSGKTTTKWSSLDCDDLETIIRGLDIHAFLGDMENKSITSLDCLTKAQLVEECRKFHLRSTGTKDFLRATLKDHLDTP